MMSEKDEDLSPLSRFCRDTSLHGWKYCHQAKGRSLISLSWFIVIAVSVCSAGYMVVVNVQDFRNVKLV